MLGTGLVGEEGASGLRELAVGPVGVGGFAAVGECEHGKFVQPPAGVLRLGTLPPLVAL